MADGNTVYYGAVAMNGVPFGTKYQILSGTEAGQVKTVEDRIGSGSEFDIWMGSCDQAIQYGRQQINIQRV